MDGVAARVAGERIGETAGMAAEESVEVDVVVIGAGPAGENAAGRCADGGLSVAIVERELVGGECSYWACIPSKSLLRPGEVLAEARRVPGAAEAVTGRIDVAAALGHRDEMISHLDDSGQVPWLEEHHVRLVRGEGRLAGPRTVVVSGSGGDVRLTARRAVVLATGTRASLPPVEGLAEARPWTNREATEAKDVPRRFAVLGGGPVGVELAQAYRRLGAEEVTLLEAGPRVLAREEPFAGDDVRAGLEASGVTVQTGVTVQRVSRAGSGEVRLSLEGRDDVVADELLVAAGRSPATGDLGLSSVGLEDGRPVATDDRLRATGVPGDWLYAVGDCNGKVLLTHMGKYQARIAADVILGKDARDRASDAIVPRVTFTDPQVAAVGLTEAQARERGLQVRTVRYATTAVAGASTRGNGSIGTSQLVVDASAGVLVGATFTGAETAELVHSATVAIAGRVPLDDLWHAVPSFPTVSEVWLRLLEAYGL